MSRRKVRPVSSPIHRITSARLVRQRQSGKTVLVIEWVDHEGSAGATGGLATRTRDGFRVGKHMHSLLARARREGVPLRREVW